MTSCCKRVRSWPLSATGADRIHHLGGQTTDQAYVKQPKPVPTVA